MINIRPLARFCSRKFYELVQEQDIPIIPEIPEDAVLSKYISFKDASKSHQGAVASWQKQKSTKLDYSALLNGSPYGSVQNFIHRNHQLTLISTNYYRTDEKKLHKLLYQAKPDAIVIQRRPEYHLHNFNMFPKGSDGVFSDRLYLNQIQFTSAMLHPVKPTYRPMVDAMNKTIDDVLQKNPAKEILQEKGFQICTGFSSSYQTPMFFGQIPLRSYRQWLANSHTLMELQQIFKVVCQRIPRYKHLSFTPYQMATLIYPDIFLKMNDTYMATIIQMLISTKSYKKIVGIFGIVENEAVRHILQKNQALKPVIEYLIPPGPKGSIVRDLEQLEIIEKQILLDVLFFGSEVQNIKSKFFHTTNAVIERYAKEIDKKTLMQFRYDKTIHYLNLLQTKFKEGEEEIKKQFVRETLRDKKN